MVIAAVFFSAAVPLIANAMHTTSGDTERVAAQSIAQQKMEQIRGLQFDQLADLTNGAVDLTTWMGGTFNPNVVSYVGTAGKTYTVAYSVTFNPSNASATAVSNGVYAASWNQSGATANDTFSFTAQATNASQIPGNPFVADAQLISGQNPNPVTNFTIAKGNGRLLLTWDNSTATDFDHYEIWRGPSSSTMTQLVANMGASGYIDTGLTNGTTYYYEVRVVDTDGNPSTWVTGSAAPAVQSDTTTPAAPGSFTATRSNANASLGWTVPAAGSSGIAGYFIYRDGSSLPYARYAPGGATGSALNFTDVIGYSIPHTYYVVALDGVGLVSAPTSTLTINTATAPTFTLTVTTTKSTGVSVDVVQSDAQPDPQDDGTLSPTSLASAVWSALPYGSYQITATCNGTQVTKNITLTQNTTVASGF